MGLKMKILNKKGVLNKILKYMSFGMKLLNTL